LLKQQTKTKLRKSKKTMPKNDAAAGAPPAPAQKQWRTEQCVAICDYEGSTNEISFQKGDVISVTGKRGDSSGFWEGITTGVNIDIMTGKKNKHLSTDKEGKGNKKSASAADAAAVSTKGLFPTCMVSSNMRAYNEPRFCDKVLVLYDYAHKTNDEADLCKGDVWTVTRPSTSPGWWYGVKEGAGQRVGDAAMAGGPSAGKTHKSYSSAKSSSSEKLIPINFVTSKLVVGGLPCQGNATNELPMSAGDVLQLIRKWNDGWWEGMLRGKRGIFPSNLVHPNVSTITPPLFCQKCKTILQYHGAAVAGATGKCTECAEHERVVDCMLESLVTQKHMTSNSSSSGGGAVDRIHLFALVDEELLYGKKFLQDVQSGGTSAAGAASSNLDTTTVRRFHAAAPSTVVGV
jgi:hypothetical protein